MAETRIHHVCFVPLNPGCCSPFSLIAPKKASPPPDRDADSLDPLDEKLGRLSKKEGVRAALVLDRATGALLKASGDVSALRISNPPPPAVLPTAPPVDTAGQIAVPATPAGN